MCLLAALRRKPGDALDAKEGCQRPDAAALSTSAAAALAAALAAAAALPAALAAAPAAAAAALAAAPAASGGAKGVVQPLRVEGPPRSVDEGGDAELDRLGRVLYSPVTCTTQSEQGLRVQRNAPPSTCPLVEALVGMLTDH